MTAFTAASYLNNAGRTEAEMKQAFEDNLAATKQLLGAVAQSTLTLAADQITPTGAFHLVDTQGAAGADNCAQILQTNLPDGSWLIVGVVNASHVVTFKHAAGGTGQLTLAGAVDFVIDDLTTFLVLQRKGTLWEERGRDYGADGLALKAFYAVAGLTQNTFTGRQEWNQGANIASGATLTLGTDGNYFLVTGTTTITAISSAPKGTRIALQLQSAGGLIVHSATLNLAAGTHLGRAGEVLEFVAEAAGVWRQVSPAGAPNVLGQGYINLSVASTAAETTVYTTTVRGGWLGTLRMVRLTLLGVYTWGVNDGVANFIHGTVFKIKYGATTMAAAYLVGGVNDNAGATDQVLPATGIGVTLTFTLAARAATNSQLSMIAKAGPQFANNVQNIITGQLTGRANGTNYPAIGSAVEDSTADKTLTVTVQHSVADAANAIIIYNAMLELLP